MGKKYVSTEYDKFKELPGNRPVEERRVKKLMESLIKTGYRESQPVIINKFGQKVDGQARIEACKRLGIPFIYEVDPDAGILECININNTSTSWKMENYVRAYVENGYEPYSYLQLLMKEFSKDFGFKTISAAFTGSFAGGGGDTRIIKNGKLKGGEIEYVKARRSLSWLKDYSSIIKRIGGQVSYWHSALLFCFSRDEIDIARLWDTFYRNQSNLYPVSTVMQALALINIYYNKKKRNGIVDIEQLYKEHVKTQKLKASMEAAKKRQKEA